VLKNMPETALQMRADQERPSAAEIIVTPFSTQADEDAKRFEKEHKKETPEPPSAPAAEVGTPPAKTEKVVEKVDPKKLVADAIALPGVDGCAITFSDGLSLAGNLPAAIAADGLCAMAPTLLERIGKHMIETKLGPLDSMTLQGSNSAITFFLRGNICLSALHVNGILPNATRAELARMIEELSRTYSETEK
jgi:predicted regulator of Ras-like GTPase activity (Roadblock/LC7/MglB family)